MSRPSQSPLQVGRECYLHAMGRELLVEILGIARQNIWVSYPSADVLCVGTGLDLTIPTDAGGMAFHARVAVVPSEPAKGIMIERCETAEHRTERRDWRVPTDLSVEVRSPKATEGKAARMLDLTDAGALLTTAARFSAGDMVEMRFQLPDNAPHRVLAQVVYSNKTGAKDCNKFGLRFIQMNRAARSTITWFLYERIQDLYPDVLRDMYPVRNVVKARRHQAAEL